LARSDKNTRRPPPSSSPSLVDRRVMIAIVGLVRVDSRFDRFPFTTTSCNWRERERIVDGNCEWGGMKREREREKREGTLGWNGIIAREKIK
jgi:hypothetical protein